MVEQVPSIYRRPVGDLVITAIGDGYLDMPISTFSNIEEQEAEKMLAATFHSPSPRLSVNAFAIQGGGRTILIDAGTGGLMGPTLGRVVQNLKAAGIAPDSVETVLLTHMHGDHFGGMLDAQNRAVFPRAEMVVSETDAKFWLDENRAANAPEHFQMFFQAAKAAADAYRDRMRTFNSGSVMPGIEAVPLPGHTPGHTGYRVSSGSDQVLLWGDIAHLPDVQMARPEVTMAYDSDANQAAETRRRVLDMAASDKLAIAGSHLHFPAFSHVVRDGNAYRLVPESWHHVI